MMRRNGNERAVTTATLKNFDFAFFYLDAGLRIFFDSIFLNPDSMVEKLGNARKNLLTIRATCYFV